MAAPTQNVFHPRNVESTTLIQCVSTLTTAVSADLVSVANKCAAKELISLQQLGKAQNQSKIEYDRASELVYVVIHQVSVDAMKFDVFLGILKESRMFTTMVREVRNKFTDASCEKGIYIIIVFAQDTVTN